MGKNISRRKFFKKAAIISGAIVTTNFKRNVSVFAQSEGQGMPDSTLNKKKEQNKSGTGTGMRISVKANGRTTVFELNDSQAARDLYAQLPLTLPVEDYASNEKIFYPPEKLNTADTPLAKNVQPGTLAYYAPWGDVVMFYERFGSAAGLYELGHAVSGKEYIQEMSGEIRIEKIINP